MIYLDVDNMKVNRKRENESEKRGMMRIRVVSEVSRSPRNNCDALWSSSYHNVTIHRIIIIEL